MPSLKANSKAEVRQVLDQGRVVRWTSRSARLEKGQHSGHPSSDVRGGWRWNRRPPGQSSPLRGTRAGKAISRVKQLRPEGPKELSKAVRQIGGTRNERS